MQKEGSEDVHENIYVYDVLDIYYSAKSSK